MASEQPSHALADTCRVPTGGLVETAPPWQDEQSHEWRAMTVIGANSEALLESDAWAADVRPGSRVEFSVTHPESGITVWIHGLRALGSSAFLDGQELGPGLVDLMACESGDCSQVWLWSDARLVEPDMVIAYSDGTQTHELACPYLFLDADELYCARDGTRSGGVFSIGTAPRCAGPGLSIGGSADASFGDVLCGGLDAEVWYRVVP